MRVVKGEGRGDGGEGRVKGEGGEWGRMKVVKGKSKGGEG